MTIEKELPKSFMQRAKKSQETLKLANVSSSEKS
jgi:hypothetical protein